MAEPTAEWDDATFKVSVPINFTTMTERQEVDFPLSALLERLTRLEAALAGAVTALELLHDGQTTMSAEEIVERILYPENFDLADRMRGKKQYERINIARGTTVFGE